jgi:hypothetical protein
MIPLPAGPELILFPADYETNLSDIRKLAHNAWLENPAATIKLVVEKYNALPAGDLSLDATLAELAEAVEQNGQLDAIVAHAPILLPEMIRYRSSLLTDATIWNVPDSLLEKLFGAVDKLPELPPNLLVAALLAALHAGKISAASYFVERSADVAVPVALTWFEESKTADVNRHYALFDGHGEVALNWFFSQAKVGSATSALVLRAIGYSIRRLKNTDVSIWLPLAHETNLSNEDVLLRSHVALLELALSTDTKAGAALAAATFGHIHQSIIRDILPWGYWDVIKPSLPEISWSQRWDKAEQLRQGLIDRFINYAWPLEKFAEIVLVGEIWQQMIGSTVLRYRHERFIGAFLRDVQDRRLDISLEDRRKLLQDHI